MRLIKVVDTRQKLVIEEAYGDRCIGIPGTGIDHECSMCGSIHEIHAYIEDDQGNTILVGVGCAKKIDGIKSQMKLLEIHEKMEALKSPGKWSITQRKNKDSLGRYEFEINVNSENYVIASSSQKEAVLYAVRSKIDWKEYFSNYYRFQNQLKKWERL